MQTLRFTGLWLGGLLLLSGLVGRAAQASASTWVNSSGQVTYTLVHKLHVVHGVAQNANPSTTTPNVSITAVVDTAAAKLKLMGRIAVRSFDSSNANRDVHMLEVVDAATFPYVTLRAVAEPFQLPALQESVSLKLKGEIDLHGSKTYQDIFVTLQRVDATQIHVTFHFEDSLTAHKIVRPALFFVPVDDTLRLEGNFVMQSREPPAAKSP